MDQKSERKAIAFHIGSREIGKQRNGNAIDHGSKQENQEQGSKKIYICKVNAIVSSDRAAIQKQRNGNWKK